MNVAATQHFQESYLEQVKARIEINETFRKNGWYKLNACLTGTLVDDYGFTAGMLRQIRIEIENRLKTRSEESWKKDFVTKEGHFHVTITGWGRGTSLILTPLQKPISI